MVGASLAGLAAAETIRERGFGGTLTVIDGATTLPPDRPPLSKQVLAGTMAPEAASQPVASRLDELALDVRLGTAATGLRVRDRVIELGDGNELGYDGLVIASGATPRRIETDLEGVHTLRTLEDAVAIRDALARGPRRCVVVGAGFIGAEVAATARSLGIEVSVVEFAPRPMQRVLPGEIGGFVADVLSDHGVELRFGVGVERFHGGAGVERVELTDGSAIDADLVVVGVGVTPNTAWLEGSGLGIDDGVVSDRTCRVAPGIVAAGDVARWFNPLYGESMRVEQWENAIEQGAYAGSRLLRPEADVAPFAPVPWFWSDLFDRKLQLAGRVQPGDDVLVVDGSLEDRRFVALFRRADRCVAVLGVNRPRWVVQLRGRMAEPLSWADALAVFA